MTTKQTTSAPDALTRLKEDLDSLLMWCAERDMDARDRFAHDVQQTDLVRRRVSRIHRSAGLGDPVAYKARPSLFRELEVAS